MKKWMVQTLAVVCLLTFAASAWSVPIPVGTFDDNLVATTGAAPWGSLTYVAHLDTAYTGKDKNGKAVFTGSLRTVVFREESGTLDFWYQVTGSAHRIDRISVDNYAGYSTDMYFVTDGSLLPPETLGNVGTVGFEKFTHYDADVIGANFDGGLAAQTSNWWVVRTDAKSYQDATAYLQNGAQAQAACLAPAPLPGSLVLVGTGLLTMAGTFVRRLRKPFVL